jgi:hypothetical protein
MPIFDDRFARQNRCEPPPEFPLASPYTGIVHLFSGPTRCAHTQIHPKTSRSVDGAPRLPPTFTFISRWGLTPEHSHNRATPWSVFQDGSLATITPASLQGAYLGPLRGMTGGYNTREEPRSPRPSPPRRTDAGLGRRSALARTPADPPAHKSGRERFPFNNFTCCLTLFSKCFSSFDHSTCALSVSGRYLALEGVYLPFRAAFPNYSTRRGSFTEARLPTARGSHPLRRPVPGNSDGASPKASSANYNSDPGARFQI